MPEMMQDILIMIASQLLPLPAFPHAAAEHYGETKQPKTPGTHKPPPDPARISDVLTTVTRGLDPRIHPFRKKMVCRVKPRSSPAMTTDRFNINGHALIPLAANPPLRILDPALL